MPRCWAEVKYLGWSDGTRYINVVSSPRCMFSVLIQCKNLTVFCQQKGSILSISLFLLLNAFSNASFLFERPQCSQRAIYIKNRG